ncbi:MAG TPA: TonB-dependent receptor [Vicinamibacteria bacterium]|nr:TonB-dependent receptor [Vicinamibacteria bacterium]
MAGALLAPNAVFAAEKDGGGLLGWVENTQGTPVAGAVVSVFGKGIRGGSLVTLSDSSGQFFLPSLPAGSYTLRALGNGHQPAPAQTVTVLPHQDSVFTVSLKPVGGKPEVEPASDAAQGVATDDESDARRELRWLIRHKRRSVLEDRDQSAPVETEGPTETYTVRADLDTAVASYLPAVAGTFEVVTTPALIGEDGALSLAEGVPTSQGVLKLHGKMADFGEWKLGGLVTESEGAAWRMAAEFTLTPGGGHEIQTGAGYGTRYLRPLLGEAPGTALDTRSVGSIFARDSWRLGEAWTASVGTRYSYVGFLKDGNDLDGFMALERAAGKHGRVHGSFAVKTLAPGGDLLTLSSLASAPVLNLVHLDDSLRPERTARYELGFDRVIGQTTISTFVFREGVRNQLVNLHGRQANDTLHILNGGSLAVEAVGVTLAHRLGNAVSGSLTYSYGRAWREGVPVDLLADASGFSTAFREAGYHDVVARVETFIDLTDTRLTAYYRVNTLEPEAEAGVHSVTNGRFDIRLTQGLPFLQPITRADWELLVAVRNLFYEDFEGASLDEIASFHAPKRFIGGFAVKF